MAMFGSSWDEDGWCSGCARLEKDLDRLDAKYHEALQEIADLKAELAELQYRLEGLEK